MRGAVTRGLVTMTPSSRAAPSTSESSTWAPLPPWQPRWRSTRTQSPTRCLSTQSPRAGRSRGAGRAECTHRLSALAHSTRRSAPHGMGLSYEKACQTCCPKAWPTWEGPCCAAICAMRSRRARCPLSASKTCTAIAGLNCAQPASRRAAWHGENAASAGWALAN